VLYDLFQTLMGAQQGRRLFAQRHLRAQPGNRVLDVGCGTAQILRVLPEGIDYRGFDVSATYIAAARREFGHRGEFTCGRLDAAALALLPSFDLVLASGLLHHLDDREAQEFFALARRALRPGGRLVSIDPCLASGQNPLARLLIERDRGRFVRTEAGYLTLAVPFFLTVQGAVSHRRWIPYTHYIMECRA